MAKFVAIGERLSTTAPIINKAFTERDPEPILKRAEQQLKAGATYLDVNIGPAESDGEDLMKWAVELLQGNFDNVPLALDTSNKKAIEAGISVYNRAKGKPIVNSADAAGPVSYTHLDVYKRQVIPLGKDVTSVIHVVSVAIRAALIFGNVTAGDAGALMEYTMKRVPAFVNAFAPLDPVIVACGAGAIALGFPVITNEDTFKVPKSLIVQPDVSKFNATSLEARDIKIKITNIDIPVAYASAFEGEIIRRKDMQVEFDGSRVDCFELVQTKDMSEVEDHKIEVIGPDIDTFEVGSKHSLAYIVEVAGKSMQPDFEPVIERKFHSYLNCVEGAYHTGQRDICLLYTSRCV